MNISPDFQKVEYIDVPVINAPATPDSSLFAKAIVFGIGGALAGTIVYALFIGLTHIQIGYLSILVAFLVAKAMVTGSNGQGGRYYQITAIILTYLAVAAANVAILIWTLSRDGEHIHYSLAAIVGLAKIGLEYPFLEIESSPGGGLLGLFILFIGLRAAWRMLSGNPADVRHPFAR